MPVAWWRRAAPTTTPTSPTTPVAAPVVSTEGGEAQGKGRELVAQIATSVAAGLAAMQGDVAATARLLDRPQLVVTAPIPPSTPGAQAAALALRTGVLVVQSKPNTNIAQPPAPVHVVDTAAKQAGLSVEERALLRAVVADADGNTDVDALLAALRQAAPAELVDLLGRFVVDNARLLHVIASPSLVAGLAPQQRAAVDALAALGADINALRIGRAVRELLLSPSWRSAAPAERSARFSALVADRASYLSSVDDPGAPPPSATLHELVDGPCDAAHAHFRLSPGAAVPGACRIDARYDDGAGAVQTVAFIVPAGAPSSARVQQLAAAVAHLPPRLRAAIDRVVLNPGPNPDDDKWRADPSFSPTHTSAMSADAASGTVTVYGTASSDIELVGLLAHEAAHLLEPLLDDPAEPSLRAAWVAARAADELRPSAYAFSSASEDFAETVRLYVAVQASSSAQRAAYRALMPARFAAMDALFP